MGPEEELSRQRQEQSKGPEANVHRIRPRSNTVVGLQADMKGSKDHRRTLAFVLGEMGSHLQGSEQRGNMM